MFFALLAQIVSFLLDLVTLPWRSRRDKDLEILLLRHQLAILQRTQPRPAHLTHWERLVLAVLTARLARLCGGARSRLSECLLLFRPDTVLRWHRDLVRGKWTVTRRTRRGRPRIDPELEELVLRLARENPGWGYSRIHGELRKLGLRVGRSTVRDILKRHRVPPAPERARTGTTWRQFLARHRHQVLACDFLVVESLRLKTLYVLFFIELGTRRVHLAGCTAHPTGAWVAQQARNLAWRIQDGEVPCRFLIHDRDAKFSVAFDHVFVQEGVGVVLTPPRCPQANAVAERWIRSARQECLDHLLILGERQLHRTLTTYCQFYNERRPHQGLGQRCPVPLAAVTGAGPVIRRDALGGLLHDYSRAAA
jgi:transposase InsO family protein